MLNPNPWTLTLTLCSTPNQATRPRVAFLEWTDPLFVGGHWVPSLIGPNPDTNPNPNPNRGPNPHLNPNSNPNQVPGQIDAAGGQFSYVQAGEQP